MSDFGSCETFESNSNARAHYNSLGLPRVNPGEKMDKTKII